MLAITDKQKVNAIRKAIRKCNEKDGEFASYPYTVGWIEQICKE